MQPHLQAAVTRLPSLCGGMREGHMLFKKWTKTGLSGILRRESLFLLPRCGVQAIWQESWLLATTVFPHPRSVFYHNDGALSAPPFSPTPLSLSISSAAVDLLPLSLFSTAAASSTTRVCLIRMGDEWLSVSTQKRNMLSEGKERTREVMAVHLAVRLGLFSLF